MSARPVRGADVKGMIRFLHGHNLDRLRELPDQSVHCCVTSPPYWNLRDYKLPAVTWPTGWTGQHGLEPTIDLFVQHEVLIFREVRRVLREDGVCWVNLGDSYATSGGHTDTTCNDRRGRYNIGNRPDEKRENRSRPAGAVKPKDLCGIPWRVAFALQADGWYLRCDVIWHKPNPMPESVTDRPTKSHEYIFLLTKNESYFYDHEAIKEPVNGGAHSRAKANGANSRMVKERAIGRENSKPNPSRSNIPGVTPKSAAAGSGIKANESFHAACVGLVANRNKRSVWTVATAPFKGAHFATFPPALITPCILAGTSAKGCCAKCGSPWEWVTSKPEPADGGKGSGNKERKYRQEYGGNTDHSSHLGFGVPYEPRAAKTVGWRPACECGESSVVPCTVLDPFGGSGTVGQVASDHGRDAILIDLNPEYLQMSRDRLGLFAPVIT